MMDLLIEELKNKYEKEWWKAGKEFPEFKVQIGYFEKLSRERRTDKFINRIFKEFENCPEGNDDRKEWRTGIQRIIEKFAKENGFKEDELSDKYFNDFSRVTNEFLHKVRKFNPDFKLEDTGQALRNVWIMNIIQVLFEMDVRYTPSIFAYSMLYPYTDNYLDDTEISYETKCRISKSFEKRLMGQINECENTYEKDLSKLVFMIEKEFERKEFPMVYESLLAIHSAQNKSLRQQKGKLSPYERDILGISVEKGGMSVLADAYLVKGILTPEEASFMFGYGVLLQLCDDLQDAGSDLKNGHMTVFSQTAGKWPLDNITNALFNFLYNFLENDKYFNSEENLSIKKIIEKNVTFLIIEAISQNAKLYTKDYIVEIEKYCAFRMKYIRNIYKKVKKKYSSFKHHKGFSIDDIIGFAVYDENL